MLDTVLSKTGRVCFVIYTVSLLTADKLGVLRQGQAQIVFAILFFADAHFN